MSTRPIIFISAVSKELHSARDLVAKTLIALGFEPKWQDIAPTDAGDLRGVLRKWIDNSDAVLQLVGHCYGSAPATPDPDFGECSYTQYEALYARQQGKKVYYILADDTHPTDGCGCEPKASHALQDAYRKTVKDYGSLYHITSSLLQTEVLVRRMRDDLVKLHDEAQKHQRSLNRKIVLVLGLLVVLVIGSFLLMHRQKLTDETVGKTAKQLDQLAHALSDFRQIFEIRIKGGSESKLATDYETALRFIADKHGISLAAFRTFLEQRAIQAQGDAAASMKYKVRAFQEAGQFVESRDFALEQARRLEAQRQKSSKEEAELWIEAAKTEIILGHYAKGLEYANKAVSQTDRQADFPTWSAACYQQGRALRYVGRNKDAQALFEELIPLQQAALGPDALSVLQSRRIWVLSIYGQGNYALAEQQGRHLVADCQRVLGAQHDETLASRTNLAIVLKAQGKYAEAEPEYREVSSIMERVLGAEHPWTLSSRVNWATALISLNKPAEAEQESRAVLNIEERVLGADHPDTLICRRALATALDAQARHAEAEQEYRAVVQIMERVLHAEHPETLASRTNLARALNAQGKNVEAEQEHREVLKISERVLHAEHPHTLSSLTGLANALQAQGKHAEAEQKNRAALNVLERVLGAEHPDVALCRYNLALCLEAQQKLSEAFQFVQQAEQVFSKALGTDNPRTKLAIATRQRLEAVLKQEQIK